MVALPTLEGGSSNALDVSYDGRVIGGSSKMGGHQVAVRWVDGVVSTLGQTDRGSIAYGVSGNGKVLVGDIADPGYPSGFRWDETSGLVSVEQWLRTSGVSILDGSTYTARATNCDGSVVVGGTFPSGFGPFVRSDLYIARGNGTGPSTCSYTTDVSSGDKDVVDKDPVDKDPIDNNPVDVGAVDGDTGMGLITLTDLNATLGNAAATNATTVNGLGLLLNGAGSRPLDRRAPAQRNIVWLNGDLGRDDHGTRDGSVGVGELGVGRNLGAVQINGAIGVSGNRQNSGFGGSTDVLSTYAKLETIGQLYPTNAGGLWGVLTGTALLGSADITRNYIANGGLISSSTGKTDLTGFGIRGRLQWENMVPYLSPYVEASHAHACMDGYSETGGAFPASFDKLCDNTTQARIGFDARVPVSETVNVIGTLEAIHRFQSAGSNVTGQVIGLGAFNVAASPYEQDWMRAGLGAEAKFGDTIFSIVGNVTSAGESPNTWIGASVRTTF
ncbi:autotransporter domain-containing protein [Hoeflea sp. IMCC20628]|uniref:autotransporter domain-containing protein n=1 Tax=Hoeflea sp. IMCC20628 TaxID=1620421 RepID=UPI0018CFD9CD|nr:autotransporter domain-containing protein [Hoeflea sp. IMCC20628]